ncbi:MAG: hypothetical protein ACO2PO_02730 [Candidatus Calescibacterium sp.]
MKEKDKRKGIMNFLTLENIGAVMKEEIEREREEKERRRIECWVCGKEGTISFSFVKKYTYVYCVHSEKEKCYLGRADRLLNYFLFGIKKQKQEQGGEEK